MKKLRFLKFILLTLEDTDSLAQILKPFIYISKISFLLKTQVYRNTGNLQRYIRVL